MIKANDAYAKDKKNLNNEKEGNIQKELSPNNNIIKHDKPKSFFEVIGIKKFEMPNIVIAKPEFLPRKGEEPSKVEETSKKKRDNNFDYSVRNN